MMVFDHHIGVLTHVYRWLHITLFVQEIHVLGPCAGLVIMAGGLSFHCVVGSWGRNFVVVIAQVRPMSNSSDLLRSHH